VVGFKISTLGLTNVQGMDYTRHFSAFIQALALKILDDKREKDGMERIAPRVPHLALAEKLGLGKSRLEDIELVAIDLG